MKKLLKDNRYSIISFVIASVIVLFVYALKGITPFGTAIISGSDNYHQYAPFLKACAEKILNGESLIYSAELGLGGNWLGNIYNYLISPFNAVIFLTGTSNVHLAMTIIVLLKSAVASFTFSYFLRKTTKKSNIMTTVFGVLYGLSGYFLAFCLNVMWLDGMYIFPIVIYGLRKIVYENKRGIYTAALAYALITNYYIGYMICIATVLFYLYLYFSGFSIKDEVQIRGKNKKRFVLTTLSYVIGSGFAVLISAFVLLPQYLILKTTPAISSSFTVGTLIKFLINPFDVLSSLSTFYTPSNLFGDKPNIFCGTLTVILAALFFVSKSITKRKKIASAALISIFMLCFMVSGLNLIWHAFSAPHGFAQRFAFIFSFLMLWIAYEALQNLEGIPKKSFCITSAAIITAVAVSFMISEKNIALGIFYLFLAAVIFGVLYVRQYHPPTFKFTTRILIFFVAAETLLTACAQIPKFTYNNLPQELNIGDENERAALYDAGNEYTLPYNNPTYYGYKGIDVFSSIFQKDVSQTMYDLGAKANKHNSVSYTPSTPYFNMLFGINTITSLKPDIVSGPTGTLKTQSDDTKDTYSSLYPTGIAFGTKNIIPEPDSLDTVMNNQQKWIECATGVNGIYSETPVDITVEANNISVKQEDNVIIPEYKGKDEFEITATFEIPEDGEYFLECDAVDSFALEVKYLINDTEFVNYSANDIRSRLHYLGERKKGDVITTVIFHQDTYTSTKETVTFHLYSLSSDVCQKTYDRLIENGILHTVSDKGNRIEFAGTVNTDHLFISIPYDDNWTVYVDGKETEAYKAGRVFIGVDVTPGEHTVVMKYRQKNLSKSIIISVSSVIAFICVEIYRRKKSSFFSIPTS